MEEKDKLQDTQPTLVVAAPDDQEKRARRQTALAQLPRRVFFLLLAFGGALLLIWSPFLLAGDGGRLRQSPFFPDLLPALAATTTLLLASLLLAFLLALLLAAVALFERRIEIAVGWSGLLLRLGSRLLIFALLTPPAVLLALIGRWFLLANIHAGSIGALTPSLLPASLSLQAALPAPFWLMALVLACLPALLAAQAGARRFVVGGSDASRTAALLTLLAALLRQTGGVLSALTIVEIVFNRPGLGTLLFLSMSHGAPALIPAILSLMAVLVGAGLLMAAVLAWAAEIAGGGAGVRLHREQRPAERRLLLVVATCLLLLPLGLTAAGLRVDPQQAVRQELRAPDQLPSPTHPLGTDQLGRDVWDRVLRAGLSTVRRSSGVAALSLIPAYVLGMLAGLLSRQGEWRRESLADLLLLPLDLLLFIPLIPGTMAVVVLWGTPGGPALVLAPAVLLLPRVAHASRSLWAARAPERLASWDFLVGLSALFLGTLFVSFTVLVALEYAGLGPAPPLPTLGALLQSGARAILTNPQQAISIAAIVAVYALTFFAAADALLDAFNTKQAMADLNR